MSEVQQIKSKVGEAEITLEFYWFCVSLYLNNFLTSRLNDDTLSILQVVVYIDHVSLFFPPSIFLEYQYQKERVSLYYQQHSCMDYIQDIIHGVFWNILFCTISSSNQLISLYCFWICSRYFGNTKLTIKEKVSKIGAKAKSIEESTIKEKASKIGAKEKLIEESILSERSKQTRNSLMIQATSKK